MHSAAGGVGSVLVQLGILRRRGREGGQDRERRGREGGDNN